MTKQIIISLLLASATTSVAQVRYDVSGNVPAGTAKVYMTNLETQQTDSTDVKDGRYSFTGELAQPAFFMMAVGNGITLPVWADGEAATADFTTHTVTGSAVNRELGQWEQKMKPYYEIATRLAKEQQAAMQSGQAPSDSAKAEWMKLAGQMREGIPAIVKACCEANKTTVVPAFYLAIFGNILSSDDLLAVAGDDRAYMASPLLARLKGHVAGLRRQAVGTMFTDLTLNDTTGTARRLSDYVGKGNYVLIDFWASWCGPCRAEMPAVKAAYDRFAPKGFQIVGLSLDQNKAAWTAGIKKLGITWPQLSDLKGWQSTAASTYGVNSIPHTLLVGPDGKVVAAGLRGEELMKKLEELYQ
ncbi:putative uncharacterized protein [Prevotella sp. CAG:755]|nr:putative uncharacterized protein [Prevotella sp. CAG:755]